jgi:hypothetical protein
LIHDFRVENGSAYGRCSDAAVINFIGIHQWGWHYRANPGQPLTEAEYKLKGKEQYLRVECHNAAGHTAWSNPLFLE